MMKQMLGAIVIMVFLFFIGLDISNYTLVFFVSITASFASKTIIDMFE